MEHEVFVPVPVASLRRTLSDPVRVARCVPGFQQDADVASSPLAGRLKVRIGSHTITYRGALTLRATDGGETFSVAGDGVEARGTGSAKLALIMSLVPTDGGTTIGFAGTASGDGRIVDLEQTAALAASHRLLDRFTRQLVTESLASGEAGEAAAPSPGDQASSSAGQPEAGQPEAGASESGASGAVPDDAASSSEDGSSAERSGGPAASDEAEPSSESAPGDGDAASSEPASPADPDLSGDSGTTGGKPGTESVFDAPVPPSSLDPSEELDFTVPDEPPAEAAHARRTMIGRSTEEVDHAPPRGRYAPVPSPESGVAGITLRWIAPAAALAIASAVVVGRALRRRR
ncbi:carbon monoxide dehydrogenase [Streptomyces halstedii]|uniref:Carbon monoxide dehydrogenase n=1 Tax=Streptomyces halstedii TaxID=1944 RepID=A0ABS6TMV0_STRHA|nr:SRPBCC domain-containing protein [Streptomyces halstedii]MBV7669603.1 carbon monoxide dehydrogenase [Streptomyces halstedii]